MLWGENRGGEGGGGVVEGAWGRREGEVSTKI